MKLTDKQVLDIIELRATGNFTLGQLAKIYKVSRSYIHSIVLGNTRRSAYVEKEKLKPIKEPRFKLTDEQVTEIREKYAGGLTSTRKLGAEYGVSATQISRIVRGLQRANSDTIKNRRVL